MFHLKYSRPSTAKSCRVLILKAAQWKPHFCVLSASGARQLRAQRIKRRRNRDSSVFLLLHSGEGKKCFHCYAEIILRNCWRLLGDTEQILAGDSFHRPSLPNWQAGGGCAQAIAPRPPRP